MKKIYSPLLEGILALYLGFEWIEVACHIIKVVEESIENDATTHCSITNLGSLYSDATFDRQTTFLHLLSHMVYTPLSYWDMVFGRYMTTGEGYTREFNSLNRKERTQTNYKELLMSNN